MGKTALSRALNKKKQNIAYSCVYPFVRIGCSLGRIYLNHNTRFVFTIYFLQLLFRNPIGSARVD